MRITKHGHACVTLATDDRKVVLDPGAFTEPGIAAGADAVLITHEHLDHWTADQLLATDAPIWTIAAVAAQIEAADPTLRERVTVVAPGDRFELGEVAVTVVGEKHAVIHPELPHFDNSGYLVEAGGTSVFHPGDALTVPEVTPEVLLLPVRRALAEGRGVHRLRAHRGRGPGARHPRRGLQRGGSRHRRRSRRAFPGAAREGVLPAASRDDLTV